MFNPYDVIWLAMVSLDLLSIGKSENYLSELVVIDLVIDSIDLMKNNELENEIGESEKMKRSEARAVVWCRIANVFGAISATLWVAISPTGGVPDLTWKTTFFICLICMSITLIPFLIGCKFNLYYQKELIERPFMSFLRVWRDSKEELLEFVSRPLVNITRHNSSAVSSDTIMEETDVALVSATGNTFFIEQYSNIGASVVVPLQIYTLIQQASSFGIPFLYGWVTRRHKNEKVIIGLGMLLSIICCIFAWQLEVQRLKQVKRLDDQGNENTSISFHWLVPQFVVLGCMEGITNDGLLKFFKSQVNYKGLEDYGDEYIEIVLGVGKLFTIALIFIFQAFGWFHSSINDSRLDNYYILLICICTANFIYYCFITTRFFKDIKKREESANEGVREA
ncbi:protein NRT1/ PTR FAMILY 5.10-like [Rutidosis leptorrhynchoides]|uniref:protein NRT1/ PTR FAMILY 5.10-like n=1 Tax=Rutidosis leptorrhynchoides TaxID=125765 RepID=UPI003A99D928